MQKIKITSFPLCPPIPSNNQTHSRSGSSSNTKKITTIKEESKKWLSVGNVEI
jgi:hypothetical protein